jgi:hypothetical protein
MLIKNFGRNRLDQGITQSANLKVEHLKDFCCERIRRNRSFAFRQFCLSAVHGNWRSVIWKQRGFDPDRSGPTSSKSWEIREFISEIPLFKRHYVGPRKKSWHLRERIPYLFVRRVKQIQEDSLDLKITRPDNDFPGNWADARAACIQNVELIASMTRDFIIQS